MKIASLWILVASMVKHSPGAPHAACSVDAIVEEVRSRSPRRGTKTPSKENLSPRQGMCNTAECVSLKSRQVACAFGVGKFAHQYRNYRNLFQGEGRKSLPRIHAATNLLVNRHLSLRGIGEALAPSCILL
jgi:hypothetical protein